MDLYITADQKLLRNAMDLGVRVGNDSELTPRTRLGSSFYSVSSQDSVTSNTTAFTSRQIALKQWYPFANTVINPSYSSSYRSDGTPIPITAIGFDASKGAIGPDGPLKVTVSSTQGGCIDLVYVDAGISGMFCIRGTHVPGVNNDDIATGT